MHKFSVLFIALLLTIITAPALGQTSGRTANRDKTAVRSLSRNALNREMLSRAEERAASLRARQFELQTREIELQGQINDLEYQATPGAIQRALAFVGSVRPMDELRDALRTRLENEKARVTKQLELVTATRQRVESALNAAEAEVERLQQEMSHNRSSQGLLNSHSGAKPI